MNDQTLKDLMRRVAALERAQLRLRIGELTDLNPLSVDLGGSGVPYTDVQGLDAALDDDATVAALTSGADMLVLGQVGGLRTAVARVTGNGGSSYTLESGAAGPVAVTSVAGQATGVCRVTLGGAAIANISDVYVAANVIDNGAFYCSVNPVTTSPVAFDVYQWSSAGAATNRSFYVVCHYRPA